MIEVTAAIMTRVMKGTWRRQGSRRDHDVKIILMDPGLKARDKDLQGIGRSRQSPMTQEEIQKDTNSSSVQYSTVSLSSCTIDGFHALHQKCMSFHVLLKLELSLDENLWISQTSWWICVCMISFFYHICAQKKAE